MIEIVDGVVICLTARRRSPMWNCPDSSNVLRNTNALTAHRARMAAAHRAGMPFLLFSAIFNPAIYIPISSVFVRRHFLPMWAIIAVAVIWIALMCASLVVGFRRRQRFLREHPQSEFENQQPFPRAVTWGRP